MEPWIRQRALELGFARVGVCDAHPPGDAARLRDWVSAGRHAGMTWMERTLAERADPEKLLPGARSVLVAALNYAPASACRSASGCSPAPASGATGPGSACTEPAGPPSGKISIYARGRDYHKVLIPRLEALRAGLRSRHPGCRTRVCIDTSPLLERYWARAAGLGWVGKNTNFIVQGLGSWVFLGAILIDRDLGEGEPRGADRCGTCRRCLDACPTRAFDDAWQLDAGRCISYLTVEHRAEIDPHLASRMGSWVFGCDDCQTVCPWNRFAVPTPIADFDHDAVTRPDLARLAALSEEEFDALSRGRGLRRAGRSRLRRNALIALGNSADPGAGAPLRQALEDPDPALRRQARRSLDRLSETLRG